MSLPPGSPEALYHAIPQPEDDANQSNIDLGGDLVANSSTDPPTSLVDSRIHWIHFVLGCSVLLPWNVMITAIPFFLSRLASSPLRSTFTSYMTTSFTAANFIFLAHATAISKHTSPSRQTRSSILWLTILTFLLTLSTFFVPSPDIFFVFVLFNGAAQATVGAYLQTSVIAVASRFGPPAVQAMMSGQAAVAVVVSGVQVLSAAASTYGKPRAYVGDGSAEERSAFMFFTLSTIFLLASAGLHMWLINMPVYQHVAASLERGLAKDREHGHNDERQGLIGDASFDAKADRENALRIARVNVTYEVAVAYVFTVTLAVFPPITSSVQPTNPNTHPLLFSAAHFLVFNVGDFLGRYICSFPIFLVWSSKRLFTLSAARTLFIPLFLMCNIQRSTSPVMPNPIISSDFIFMTILLCFGWSNGYVSSLCMMAAASLEHNPKLKGRAEDVDVAATVASFCLVGGLALGSVASFAVRGLICGCNPFTE